MSDDPDGRADLVNEEKFSRMQDSFLISHPLSW